MFGCHEDGKDETEVFRLRLIHRHLCIYAYEDETYRRKDLEKIVKETEERLDVILLFSSHFKVWTTKV